MAQADGDSFHASLTRAGDRVAFSSEATNLKAGDTNGVRDIFWREAGSASTLVRASQGVDGTQGDGHSDQASWNQDGTKVLYRTAATTLDWTESDGGARDIMSYDLASHASTSTSRTETVTTERASVAFDEAEAMGSTDIHPAVSADGRYVAFHSYAANLVKGDTNGYLDVFIRDRQTGSTWRVSVDSAGLQATGGHSSYSSLSADGRYVTFLSSATNLVAGDTNGCPDIFVHDRQTGTTTRVSVDSNGNQGAGGNTGRPAISADGRYVTFYSDSTNLVAGDTNDQIDVFVHDRQTSATTRVSVDSNGNQATGGWSYNSILSTDGRYVAFHSYATNLVAGDTNNYPDVFVHDRQTGATTRVSVDSNGNQAMGGNSFTPSLSADGRYVGFYSTATNLVTGDTNQDSDVFIHDRQTGATTRVSVTSAGNQATGLSMDANLSADGRYVAFESTAADLVAGDTNGVYDIFVHDRQTGATIRLSVDSAGNQATGGDSRTPIMSMDGRHVVFHSLATNLVAGDTNALADIFVRNVLFP